MKRLIIACMLATPAFCVMAADLLIDAESFSDKGGWVVDQQFTHTVGSPYLLAHGMGNPVADATTERVFPAVGTYRVWVRTKNWVPGDWQAPGRFKVSVNGSELAPEFGTETGWNWQDGGTVHITQKEAVIALHDLTGFEGRCDALYFTTDLTVVPPNALKEMKPWRDRLNGIPEKPPSAGTFDLVIVGGGIAGCGAALAAEEQGLNVALIHDRPVLGGNASSEVRVHTLGAYGSVSRILKGIDSRHWKNGSAEAIPDTQKRHRTLDASGVHQFLSWRACGVETEGNRITSVDARHVESGKTLRFHGQVFIDCTGDGWIGYWAGANYRYGRESRNEFDEGWVKHGDLWSPETPDNRVMGTSVLWNSHRLPEPSKFPAVPWAVDVAQNHKAINGEWQWEYSTDDLHQIDDAEEIRDHMFRAIYGSFSNAKKNPENARIALKWVAHIAGKRESRRLMGDYIYTLKDVTEHREFPDAVVEEVREIDVHYQEELNGKPQDFLSKALFRKTEVYVIPFRCLYSRNIENLMMAGRCFSCSHIGLGGPRVMRTTGQMGVATGYAAALCVQHNTTPRIVGQQHIKALHRLIDSGGIDLNVAQETKEYSGIYPHLAFFNNEGECGTGAVVLWADRLWVITYGPHFPKGSSDKLYEITNDLDLKVRPESIGGTPANRMIHRESEQLIIGPYVIDKDRNVRVIPYRQMPGRHTGTARHLSDPTNRIYIATMEEGLYEVDVHTLAVTELIKDGHKHPAVGDGKESQLPGYHGKGLYSGQGILVYSNNGEKSSAAQKNPFVPSGALASWDGAGDWQLIRRNQFAEVTGPGGIHGNDDQANDPLWAVGWDARSLILMTVYKGKWHSYRLPKASHSYDGAHGWNTEWPRIREIGEEDLLMTMHGMFWRFPKSFTPENSKGIAPRSTYLKVIGDFCRWNDRIVFGCDDTANKEFLNKRKAKGHIAAPQSQSNLWFIDPERLDNIGPAIGRGAVWLNDPVDAHKPSDAFLIDGFSQRAIHLAADKPTTFAVEIDREGNGEWKSCGEIAVEGYAWYEISPEMDAVWMRLKSSEPLDNATAWFHLGSHDDRPINADPTIFNGVARVGEQNISGGLIRARDKNKRTLHYAASAAGRDLGCYDLDGSMKLTYDKTQKDIRWIRKNVAIPPRKGVLEVDEASVIYIDDNGKRFRIPKNPQYTQAGPLGYGRLCREVTTERDLFNCHGTFFELPARNAGGFGKIRPVSSHNLAIKDFCSYRGLFVLSGVNLKNAKGNKHIIRSADGKTGLWVGAIDDIWALGKPVGTGGPWKHTTVKTGEPSDPYLMTGFDKKTLTLWSKNATGITAEIDISGMGDWHAYKTWTLGANETLSYEFPDAFQAYWIRFRADAETTASAQLMYQ